MKELENKVALVSSSTRGIGLACAKTLAAQGAAVYLGVRRLEAGQQIADELIAAGGRAGVVFFDASREESFSGMVDEVAAKEGRLDILVNNFGSTDVKTDLDVVNGPSEDFFRIVNTNLKSVYLPSKAAVPLMAKNGGGSIINTASMSAHIVNVPQPQCAYNASKAGVIQLTKSLAIEWAKKGVRVNCISPGYMATELTMNSPTLIPLIEKWNAMAPMGRMGKPEELESICVYLAGDTSTFTTGTDVIVDGAFTCF